MACSVFGSFPVSAEAERQFSTAGKIMTLSRATLDPVWLRINTLIRLNMDMVLNATEGEWETVHASLFLLRRLGARRNRRSRTCGNRVYLGALQ